MAAKVFISYRRDDSAGHAGRVHDRLMREFGRDLLFMDVDAIPLGADFVEVLSDEVAKCDVLLAIIGPAWLDARDESSNRRLVSDGDFVRIEIAAALDRDIPVIPILLEGTRMPRAEELPHDLIPLARRNALDVRHSSFHADMDRLIRSLRALSGQGGPNRNPEPRIKVEARAVHGAPNNWFKPGDGKTEWFKDNEDGPEMVVVPAGRFTMGSPDNEPQRESVQGGTESPQRQVTIAQPFAVSRHAITRGQFAAFCNGTGHRGKGAYIWKDTDGTFDVARPAFERMDDYYDPDGSWQNPGFVQDYSHPVVCIDWDDAKAYVDWLSQVTGKSYYLLSEAEWEYCCRAGAATPFWWGEAITPTQANYNGNYVYAGGGNRGEYRNATVSVGRFAPNPWGLYQMHGNVWEWCEDVWHDSYYDGAPPLNGVPWLEGGDLNSRVRRGGSWVDYPWVLRSAYRSSSLTDHRASDCGFRVRRTL